MRSGFNLRVLRGGDCCLSDTLLTRIIHEHVVRLAAFASKTELRKPEKRGCGLSSGERGAQPFRPARPVAGLRRIFRAITTACSDGFRRERAESLKSS